MIFYTITGVHTTPLRQGLFLVQDARLICCRLCSACNSNGFQEPTGNYFMWRLMSVYLSIFPLVLICFILRTRRFESSSEHEIVMHFQAEFSKRIHDWTLFLFIGDYLATAQVVKFIMLHVLNTSESN